MNQARKRCIANLTLNNVNINVNEVENVIIKLRSEVDLLKGVSFLVYFHYHDLLIGRDETLHQSSDP